MSSAHLSPVFFPGCLSQAPVGTHQGCQTPALPQEEPALESEAKTRLLHPAWYWPAFWFTACCDAVFTVPALRAGENVTAVPPSLPFWFATRAASSQRGLCFPVQRGEVSAHSFAFSIPSEPRVHS